MTSPRELHDQAFIKLVEKIDTVDLTDEAGTTFVKNIKTFSEARPPEPEPTPEPIPVPVTRWEKVKHGTGRIWDNETTRVFIKAGGAFAGVALVAYSTIRKDHVLERQAIAQANQRNI